MNLLDYSPLGRYLFKHGIDVNSKKTFLSNKIVRLIIMTLLCFMPFYFLDWNIALYSLICLTFFVPFLGQVVGFVLYGVTFSIAAHGLYYGFPQSHVVIYYISFGLFCIWCLPYIYSLILIVVYFFKSSKSSNDSVSTSPPIYSCYMDEAKDKIAILRKSYSSLINSIELSLVTHGFSAKHIMLSQFDSIYYLPSDETQAQRVVEDMRSSTDLEARSYNTVHNLSYLCLEKYRLHATLNTETIPSLKALFRSSSYWLMTNGYISKDKYDDDVNYLHHYLPMVKKPEVVSAKTVSPPAKADAAATKYKKKKKSHVLFVVLAVAVLSVIIFQFAFASNLNNSVWRESKSSVQISVTDFTDSVFRGDYAHISIHGVPEMEYTISVIYSSGKSSAQGLEPQEADANGNVRWAWLVGSNTSSGTYSVVISDENGNSYVSHFTVK